MCNTGKGFTCMIYQLHGGVTVWAVGVDYALIQVRETLSLNSAWDFLL